jgi:NAD(P)-dependent dehydrogenase (short-subunit alcohol dehydrogenase family)
LNFVAGAAHFCPADLVDDASIHNAGAWIAARFPSLHCLVNNAVIVRRGHIEDGS